jgi:hypothetical protein
MFPSLRFVTAWAAVVICTLLVTLSSSAQQTGRPNDDITKIISAVSESTITSYIQGMQDFGTRYCTNANRDSVFRWVRQRFLDAGVTDVAFDSFQYGGTWQKNVIATIPGTVNPTAEIIVGGHLDSYSSNLLQAPGADDNASGTTAALEMARVLIQENYQPNVTLRFIGFAAEEVGLRGSADYALKARQQNRDIKVMMNYDMIGYRNQSQPDRDFYIVWYTGSETFSNLHAVMATTYTTLTPVFTTSYRSSSDSWSFYQQSYKTVFCIERDFSPYYHSPNDLIQYLDIPYSKEIIQAGLAMVLTLDSTLVVGVAEDGDQLPTHFVLDANYPNPFNPTTVIRYHLPVTSPVTLKVYNGLGQYIATLVDETVGSGTHEVRWDAGNVPTGLYLYRLQTSTATFTRKMLFIK